MLGLGTGISKSLIGAAGKWITTDNLVLRHDYRLHPVQPLSDGAAVFDGTDDYISVGTSLWSANGDRTFSAWFRADNISSERCIFHTGGMGELVLAGTNNACFRVHPSSNQYKDTTNQITAGRWYHIVLTQTSSVRKVYVDGVEWALDGTGGGDAQTYAWHNHAGELRIGDDGTYRNFFNGHICNVGLWDAVLTQAQIKSIMWKDYAGLSASEKTNLVSWWNLDSVIPDTTTLVYDNHHGDGDTLGSELITNGDFATDSDWNKQNGSTISGGVGNVIANGGLGSTAGNWGLYQDNVFSPSTSYRIQFKAKQTSGTGNFNVGYAYGIILNQSITSSFVDYSIIFTTNSSNWPELTFGGVSIGDTFEIDNVSVKEINGNTGTLS